MRQGFFPGQLEALRELARDGLELHEYRRKSRRAFFGLGIGAVVAGGAGFWLGGAQSAAATSASRASPESELSGTARDLATATDSALLAGAKTYLMAVETLPGDDLAWGGALRLTRLTKSLPDADRKSLVERLRATAGSPRAPALVRDAIQALGPR